MREACLWREHTPLWVCNELLDRTPAQCVGILPLYVIHLVCVCYCPSLPADWHCICMLMPIIKPHIPSKLRQLLSPPICHKKESLSKAIRHHLQPEGVSFKNYCSLDYNNDAQPLIPSILCGCKAMLKVIYIFAF